MIDPRLGHTSASNALADSLCAGRHLAQVGLAEVTGDYAQTGSRIHATLAESGDGRINKLTLAEREMFDACREVERKVLIDFFGEQPPVPMRVIREERFWVRFARDSRQYEHSGQPDVVFRSGTRILIAEYKTLVGDVPSSPRNLQLRDQAVLVFGNLPIIDEIATVVIQPMVTREPQVCVYSKEDLTRAQMEMYERVVRSNTPGMPRSPGEAQCQFCKAKTLCVEYQKWAGQMTPPQMLTVLEIPMVNWSPEQRAIAADALAPAQKFLDDLKDFLKAGAKVDPNFIPGWGLRDGNTVEVITDPQTCFDRFAVIGGNLQQFMRCVSIGKTKLVEGVHEVTKLKGKSLDKVMKELTEGIVTARQNEPSLKKIKEAK